MKQVSGTDFAPVRRTGIGRWWAHHCLGPRSTRRKREYLLLTINESNGQACVQVSYFYG
jgi:hypothetical protein